MDITTNSETIFHLQRMQRGTPQHYHCQLCANLADMAIMISLSYGQVTILVTSAISCLKDCHSASASHALLQPLELGSLGSICACCHMQHSSYHQVMRDGPFLPATKVVQADVTTAWGHYP